MPSPELPALQPHRTELGTPGPLRDALVAAVLRGDKTATTCLQVLYDLAGEDPPASGARSALVDSDGQPVATLEYTRVWRVPLEAVDLRTAHDEGEGFTTVSEWRAAHERFWRRFLPEIRAGLGDPGWDLSDEEPVVVEYFRVADPPTLGRDGH